MKLLTIITVLIGLIIGTQAFADEDLILKVIQKREQERLEKIKKMEESKKKMDDFVKANETPDQKRYRELKESVIIVDGDDPNHADTIEKPYRAKPPGGQTTDIFLYKQWEFSVKHQKFPPLPKQEAGKEDFTDMSPPSKRKRYIFQLATDQLDSKVEAWDPEGGYFMFKYADPDQGSLDQPFKDILARKSRPLANASNDAKRMFRWQLQRHFREHLPLSFDCLNNLDMGSLRFLAKEFRPYNGEEAREWTRADYIKFIAGVQHERSNLVPLGAIPFGELPVLKKAEGFGL